MNIKQRYVHMSTFNLVKYELIKNDLLRWREEDESLNRAELRVLFTLHHHHSTLLLMIVNFLGVTNAFTLCKYKREYHQCGSSHLRHDMTWTMQQGK